MRSKLLEGLRNPGAAMRQLRGHIARLVRWVGVRLRLRAEPLAYQAEFRESIDIDYGAGHPPEYYDANRGDDDRRPLDLRHYQADAWEPFDVETDYETIVCNFNPDPDLGSEATLCVLPTALETVEDPMRLRERANVTSEWLDRLTPRGCSVLLVHGKWLNDFSEAADMVERGYDPFKRVEGRIGAVVRECLERGYATPGKVVAIGSSRYGYGVLHAMANNEEISGAVAHQPVVWWPNMREFSGIPYHDPIIQRNSLYTEVDRLVPRPVLLQSGYMDERVGQLALNRLIETMEGAYEAAGVPERFVHELLPIPGHSGRVPDSSLDSVLAWMERQGFIE